jgi:hypothetical protein
MSQRLAQPGARRRQLNFLLIILFLCLAILACNLSLGDRRQEENDGLHPACIKHDQCYDDCNQRPGRPARQFDEQGKKP